MYLLSVNGTLRTIVILLIIWWVVRWWMRLRSKGQGTRQRHWVSDDRRPKGDVRIEQVERPKPRPEDPGVEDAEYEVIKDKPDP